MDASDIRKQRDRFLGFAFASADLFIEVDAAEKVVFSLGAAKTLTGVDDHGLYGKHWLNTFSMNDRMRLATMMRKARDGQRCGPITVTLDERLAGGRKAIATGIRMPGSDHFFVTLGFSNAVTDKLAADMHGSGEIELLDKNTFLFAAQEALDIARGVGQDFDMTMVDIGNVEARRKTFGDTLEPAFRARVTELLGYRSLDGQTVAEVADGRFAIVHEHGVNADDLRSQIGEVARGIDANIEAFEAAAHTVTADLQSLTDREAMKALIYTVNEFERQGTSVSVDSLSAGFKAYVSANAHKMHKFKNIVAQFEFDFAFQPLVHLETGALSHYEMLCRFHDQGNTQEWIIFGEDIGMAPDLDIAICERAINFMLYKIPNSRDKFAVNLSGQSMQNEPFFRTLMAKLSLHKELASRLIFEITESTNIDNLSMVASFVTQLQRAGHKVCLDDFGSGSASFQYLQQLPVDYIKIDGSYTQRILTSSRDESLIKSLTHMCRELKIGVAAERIEEAAEAELLRSMGVQIGQGYYFGKPSAKPDYVPKTEAAA